MLFNTFCYFIAKVVILLKWFSEINSPETIGKQLNIYQSDFTGIMILILNNF